jgi:hypothetical protein
MKTGLSPFSATAQPKPLQHSHRAMGRGESPQKR